MEASTAYLSAQVNTVEPSGNVKIDSITRMLNKAARQFGALYEGKCVEPMNYSGLSLRNGKKLTGSWITTGANVHWEIFVIKSAALGVRKGRSNRGRLGRLDFRCSPNGRHWSRHRLLPLRAN